MKSLCSGQKTSEGERDDTEQLNERGSVRKRGKIRQGQKTTAVSVQNKTLLKRERDSQTEREKL